MIIYNLRKPEETGADNSVGVTGENKSFTAKFLIRELVDNGLTFSIHLRFSDGSVNTVIPDEVNVDDIGTTIIWEVKKTDIFVHGFFEIQIEGRKSDGYVFQTEIVRMFANESIAFEDKEYENPNSETIRLREEAYQFLCELKLQQDKFDENMKLLLATDITKKADLDAYENTILLGRISSTSKLNDYTDVNKTYVFFTPSNSALASELKLIDSGQLIRCIMNNYKADGVSSQVLRIYDGSTLNTNKVYLRSVGSIGDNSFYDITIPNNYITKTHLSEDLLADFNEINEDLLLKQDVSNMVSDTRYVTNPSVQYPSLKYLDYYYTVNETYDRDEIDDKLTVKADKATTLAGYGITNTYTKSEVDTALAQKLDKSVIEQGVAQMTIDGYTKDDFYALNCRYQKVGDYCYITFTANPKVTIDSPLIFSGLPFVAYNTSILAAYTGKGNPIKIEITNDTSNLTITKISGEAFTAGETNTFTIGHRIKS